MPLLDRFQQDIKYVAHEIITEFAKAWTKEVSLKRGDFLVKKGANHPYVYYVESGALHIFYPAEEKDLTIRLGYSDSFIAVFPSFLNEQATTFHIQAIKASRLIGIHKKDYFKAIAESEKLKIYWQKTLEHLVISQLDREVDLLITSPSERYQRVLARSPRLFQEIPFKLIASYLRMTPETLSRLRRS